MNTTTLISGRNARPSTRNRIMRAMRPSLSKRFALPLACAMCAALGATSVQAFTARERVLVAGIVPQGMVICDGEYSFIVNEAELSSLLDEVERLC